MILGWNVGQGVLFLTGCYLDERFSSACMFMDSHAWWIGKGLQHKLEALLWEIGTFLSLLHEELELGVPRVPPTFLPPLPAFRVTALFLSAWCMACPSGLPEALMNEAVFPPPLLSHLVALICIVTQV